jgi:hypothetical protein
MLQELLVSFCVLSSMVRLRGKLATLGLGLAAASLGLVGTGSAGRPPAVDQITYEVTTLLMSEQGGPVYGCFFILQSLPPQCGGGIRVNGADIQQTPGVIRYENGTLLTPMMHLAGRWGEHALTLTEPPRPATSEYSMADPCTQQPGTTAVGGERQLQVGNDEATLLAQGIDVTETITCGDTLGIGVVLADAATVRYLQARYGKVSVTGWLRPVSSGK